MNANASPDMLLTLLSEYWGIKDPSLIISVIADGDCEKNISKASRNSLCYNLASVARNTAAYIVTSGYHVGILKNISKALNRDVTDYDEESYHKMLPIVGISTWGAVLNRELLQNEVVIKYDC